MSKRPSARFQPSSGIDQTPGLELPSRMASEAELRAMARAVHQYLGRSDVLFIMRIAKLYPEQFAALMSAYSGQSVTDEEFARLNLRICKQIAAGGGGAS